MQDLNGFVVKYKGLATGNHHFHYVLENDFFTSVEGEELQGGHVEMDVLLEKEDTLLTFHFNFKGVLRVSCDRCLDIFDIPIEGNETLYVKFGDGDNATNEEIAYLPEQEYKIDLLEYIQQYIIIALPMKRIHSKEEECNQEMIKKIEAISNKKEETETNSCWDVLKTLKQDS